MNLGLFGVTGMFLAGIISLILCLKLGMWFLSRKNLKTKDRLKK